MTMRFMMCAALVSILASSAATIAQTDDAFLAYQAQLAAAEKSLRLNETREVRRWLDACDESMRGWEWEYLAGIADTSVRHMTMPGTPIRIAMSPTGDRVAIVEGALVRILSYPALSEIMVIDGHSDAIYRAEFNHDGTQLITVSRDVTARIWDLQTGNETARMALANPAFAAVSFDPTGTRAATCAWERDDAGNVHGLVWIWDVSDGTIVARRRVGVKPLSAIAFTPDGTNVLVGSWDGLVHVLDAHGDELRRLTLPDEDIYNAVNDIAVSSDGMMVAAASKDRTTGVFNIASGELIATLCGHGGYVEGVAFSPDGEQLATASLDATASLWDTSDWTRSTVLRGPEQTVRGIAWSRDGQAIIACALDGRLWEWKTDTDDDRITDIATGHDGIYSTALSPDASTIAVACFDGWLRLFDSTSGALVRQWQAHPGSTCHAAGWSADGQRIISSSWDHTARVWEADTGAPIAALDAGDGVYATAISPDGVHALTSGSTLKIWNVDEAMLMYDFAVDGAEPTRVEFSTDGTLAASGWDDGYIRIHDISAGKQLAEIACGKARVETVAFLPDNKRIASGDTAGVVRIHTIDDGQVLAEIDTGGRGVNHLAVHGDRLAAATDRLWLIDTQRGDTVLSLSPHEDTIWHLSWSSNGDRLATCTISGLIRILER